MNRIYPWSVPVIALGLVVSGCSSDKSTSSESSSSAPAMSTAAPAAAPSPDLEKAATEYKAYATSEIDDLVEVVKVFTDAVRANDLKAAQAAYAPSREPWERIEPLAELVENIDAATDSRVDDFAGPDDPKFTGWHRLEYLLFEKNTTEGGAPFADQLDKDIASLKDEFTKVEVAPINVAKGAAELIEEVAQGKMTGEEDRYSKTDLWDFNANLEGSQTAIDKLTPALNQADPKLLGNVTAGFSQVFDTMRPLRQGDGWVLFCTENSEFPSPLCPAVTVSPSVLDALKAQIAGLSENLSKVAGALKLS